MTVFRLPDLGEGLSEAEILDWHVRVGDHIDVDQPMLSVETAKAVVEVPSPVSGTVTALHAQRGERIEIGAPLVEFDIDAAAAQPAEAGADAGTVVGRMPTGQETREPAAGVQAGGDERPPRTRRPALPAARALARSLGVDLDAVPGSGRDGAVTVEDVISAAGLPAARPATSGRAARIGSAPAGGTAAGAVPAGAELQPLHGLRRSMAESMALARDSIAASTVFDDADLHRWRASRYTARLLRALAAGVRAEPGLNAWYDPDRQCRTLFAQVDVGIAVDTPEGLLVPVLRGVEQLGAVTLQTELERLKTAARERTVTPGELRHFTIMLSNFGTLAGRYATPLVVPPAVAILGSGRAQQAVVAVDDRIEIHRRLPLSLTFDHRVVTGAEAVRFLAAVIADLEQAE